MKTKSLGILMGLLLLTGIGFAEAASWKIIESRFGGTAGELTNTAPSYAQPVGFSLSATEAYIDVQMKP